MIHSIGLTGGIGSGKSTIAGILKQLGYPVYLADPEASRLINRSVEIRNDLTGLFGADLYTPRGMLDKKLLADIIFKNPQALSQVNRIVHPRVIRDFQHWREQQNSPLVFFESAILFEAGLTRHFDFIICLVFFYGMAIRFIIMYLNQFDELKEMSYILVFFIVLFLAIPWLMRYYQKCRYKSYLLSLERGWKLLEEIE